MTQLVELGMVGNERRNYKVGIYAYMEPSFLIQFRYRLVGSPKLAQLDMQSYPKPSSFRLYSHVQGFFYARWEAL